MTRAEFSEIQARIVFAVVVLSCALAAAGIAWGVIDWATSR